MTSPFHFFQQSGVPELDAVLPITDAWEIPSSGDGYTVILLDIPEIGPGGTLLGQPFFTQYDGSLDLTISRPCYLEARLTNCHIFQDGQSFSTVRRRFQSVRDELPIDLRFNDWSRVSVVDRRSYVSSDSGDGPLEVTDTRAGQSIRLQLILELITYNPGDLTIRRSTAVRAAVNQDLRVSWWQFRNPVSFLGLGGSPPVIPDYVEYMSVQDPTIWTPWPETAVSQGAQLGTLAGVKSHLSVDHSEDDELLMNLLDTARGYVQDYARLLTVTSASGASAVWVDPDYTRRLRLPGPVVASGIEGLDGLQTWVSPELPHDAYVILPEHHEGRVELTYPRSWTPFYGETGPRRLITTIYRVAGALYLYREATMAGDRAIQQLIEGALGIKSDVRL